ncbi:MAG: tRNA (adenosine(37)-N6)-threonylcarbamoyltransferase complex transferase subunit TsaD [Planctomycetales bacterium]
MKVLILETSCDETAAAIVNDRLQVLGATVASQEKLHARFGGVVPEIASRAHVERILPVIDETVRKAGCKLSELDAVAAANTPGLAGSLLVGWSAAKALAVSLDLPLIAVNHLQAHIYACKMSHPQETFPCVGLIVSGGHTNLYRCQDPLDFELLGSTIDDAAGEAFDKVASMLGLSYPGGPAIQAAAATGDPTTHSFPRPLLKDPQRLEFSFSGLKTAVRYRISRTEPPREAALKLSSREIADLAASFQQAVTDVLVGKSMQALKITGMKKLCVGGGVAANACFREQLTQACRQEGAELFIAPLELCTDNAVMGAVAMEQLQANLFAPLDANIIPGLVRRPR